MTTITLFEIVEFSDRRLWVESGSTEYGIPVITGSERAQNPMTVGYFDQVWTDLVIIDRNINLMII